ncbi:MAG TPA: hypothetical protein VMZ91_00680 [Candidatus Paceibacterota bacterium]|nr:hypothetical protein [Candidatus Paceibacterota bacterium]
MSKRIEELEKEIKERKNKRYNCNWDFIKSSQNIYDLQARIQERKLAEKEFLELIDNTWNNRKMPTWKIMFMMDFKEELKKELGK